MGGDDGSENSNGTETTDGTTTGNANQTYTIEYWSGNYAETPEQKKAIDTFVKAFNKNHSNIQVNVTGVAFSNLSDKLRGALSSGNAPHVIEAGTEPALVADGIGMDISEYFESSPAADKFPEGVMAPHRTWGKQIGDSSGGLYTWPTSVVMIMPSWRTDWLEQAGYSAEDVNHKAGSLSYDDLRQIYSDMKDTEMGQKQGAYPSTTSLKASDADIPAMYAAQHGGGLGAFVNEAGTEATINSPESIEAWKMVKEFTVEKEFWDPKAVEHGDEESTSGHWSGMYGENHVQDNGDYWVEYRAKKPQMMKNQEFVFGVPYHQKREATFAFPFANGLVKDADWKGDAHIEAAIKFNETWTATEKWSLHNAKNLGWTPLVPSTINENDYFAESKMHEDFWRGAVFDTLKNFEQVPPPAVRGADSIISDIPANMFQRILGQGKPVKEAADIAADEINKVLNS